MQSIKKIWAEELIDYSDEEIIAGLNSCKTKIFPPTLPEFLLLCRPPINPETAFYEAITQWENRKSFSDHWSNPAIYYAASKIGNDLSFITYDKIKFRWINAINQANEEIRSGNLPNKVPERLNELAKPQEIKISKQKANENIERIKSMISGLSERKII